jgi:hypothetical protein
MRSRHPAARAGGRDDEHERACKERTAMTPTFIDAPRATDLAALDADVAILGVLHGLTYDPATPGDASAAAPEAIRQQSRR